MAPACRDLVHGKTPPRVYPATCVPDFSEILSHCGVCCSAITMQWHPPNLAIYIYILSYIGLNAKRRHATSRCFALIFRSALHGPLFFTYIESIYMYNRKTYIYIFFLYIYTYIYIYLFDVCCMQGCWSMLNKPFPLQFRVFNSQSWMKSHMHGHCVAFGQPSYNKWWGFGWLLCSWVWMLHRVCLYIFQHMQVLGWSKFVVLKVLIPKSCFQGCHVIFVSWVLLGMGPPHTKYTRGSVLTRVF